MPRVKLTFECLACGGTYDDLSPDGTPYYHVCPENKITGVGVLRAVTPIANRRDESPVLIGEADQGTRSYSVLATKAEGAGRKPGVRVIVAET